ncbi:speckle targeted PIP5K1A-regulated poly(A) polymerase-like isoform X1 [Schistocerca americana]|uniref:speckle targeted PIP5K1A-regulated poly(A) polymerase-like isoform X1 n=2 Tax=Schistocerca americana TaxID=7009 RepID=UPI001F4F17BD|nr:speckle targeted PIP5K1A-regulated poly(A) polymerase-like isoform X1 [Schistocerca americana]XP_046981646.1 speckle targeted PIP5K1A-regulated poly(A) polymerase-like isoform X1 [Schistocerca americana]XP_046981647.1 speckle targeted PIP5K1A-regulated poly(A) polymerase-like isoform X1 [Schistocerca americana]
MSQGAGDAVPRILLKEVPKGAKIIDIYWGLQKFGTITYIGLGNDNAVIEFADRISVGKVLSSHPVRVKTNTVRASHEPEWKSISGLVNMHETFTLDPNIKAVLKNEDSFNQKIADLVSTADKLTLDFDDDIDDGVGSRERHPVCAVLERILPDELVPNVRVYPFGSRVSGTALETSDLDIFIDCGDTFYGEYVPNVEELVSIVQTVKRQLAKAWPEFNHVTAIPRARVPIVKFLHCPSNTRCDAAFTNGIGCRNARLLRFVLSLDSRVRPLLLFLKRWVYSIDLTPVARNSPRPELTSHALAMVTFTFLQTVKPPILPPIKGIKEAADYSIKVAGWETAFCNDSEQFRITDPHDRRSVRELLLGFLQCFQRIDWQKMAASPLDGVFMPRQSVPRIVPTKSAAMVVLDPFNLSRNLTVNVSDVALCRLCATCALTEREMTSR